MTDRAVLATRGTGIAASSRVGAVNLKIINKTPHALSFSGTMTPSDFHPAFTAA